MIAWADFEKPDMRVGTIVNAEVFPQARKNAHKLTIDFGERFGIKSSSVQITGHYTLQEPEGKQVITVVNFPPKQIATFISECPVPGVYAEDNSVVLLQQKQPVGNGLKIG